MATEHAHSRLLSGMSGNGRRAKRRRVQFPEPVRSTGRLMRVTPASTSIDAAAEVAELVESALRDIPALDLTTIDDGLSTVSS